MALLGLKDVDAPNRFVPNLSNKVESDLQTPIWKDMGVIPPLFILCFLRSSISLTNRIGLWV